MFCSVKNCFPESVSTELTALVLEDIAEKTKRNQHSVHLFARGGAFNLLTYHHKYDL